MAAPTETYVDPSIAGASGAGTVGDPYGDVQHALDTITRDSTNGDRINIKAGTDEILGASLSLATYGTPASGAPLVFQGYTSAANDGGIGGISGAATYSIMSTGSHVAFIDMHLHNTGSAVIVTGAAYSYFQNCEFDNTTGDGVVNIRGNMGYVTNCYFHNIGGDGLKTLADGIAIGNYFENGTNDFVNALEIGYGCLGMFNVINVDGSTTGINLVFSGRGICIGNSVYSATGTGTWISCGGGSGFSVINNNIVEGFIGAGGKGFNVTEVMFFQNNAAYNNTTNYTKADIVIDDNNETLGASAFTNAGSADFTVDTTVKATAYPTGNIRGLAVRTYLDKGALQREEAGGAGTDAGLLGGRLVR